MSIFGRLCRGARSPAAFALTGFLLLALLACEQPFRAGLGTVVDAERPGVRLTSPSGGSFLRGDERGYVTFAGDSWDDLRVEAVQFKITEHPGLNPSAEIGESDLPAYWQDVDVLDPPRRGEGGRTFRDWRHSIDVSVFNDGEFHVQLRVNDGIERDGSLWELKDVTVFFIRNTPPAITLALPFVEEGGEEGQLESRHLNFDFINRGDMNAFREEAPPQHRSMSNDVRMIVGMIRDDRGVFRGLESGTPGTPEHRFPPQFRIWEITDLPGYEPGSTPREYTPTRISLEELREAKHEGLPWQNFGEHDNSGLFPTSPTNVQFFFNFSDEDRTRYFAFQIRAQSARTDEDDDHFDTFLFPKNAWSDYAWNALDPIQQIENSFVAFRIVPPQDPPRLELLRLQDVFNDAAWNPDRWNPNLWNPGEEDGGLGEYDNFCKCPDDDDRCDCCPNGVGSCRCQDDDDASYPSCPCDGDDVRHPYLTDLAFNAKSGAFTLRVRASHPDEISDAVAFWEGGGARGIFIWDPVEPSVPANPAIDVAGTRPFSEWGRGDPRMRVGGPDGPTTVRNFVFTYQGGVGERVPAGYGGNVGGRYRIQRFRGSQPQWDALYRGIQRGDGWNAFDRDFSSGLWECARWNANGTEGVFTIRVYTKTPAGTVNSVPLVTFLTLDRGAPHLELTQMDGGAGETALNDKDREWVAHRRVDRNIRDARIVNGVIRPRIFASDSRASDSGLRASGGYFARPNGSDAEEVMFVLVPDGQSRVYMENLDDDFWPFPIPRPDDDDEELVPTFPAGITVERHGPVHDGVIYIQTSPSFWARDEYGEKMPCPDPESPWDWIPGSHADPPLADGIYWLYVFARDMAFNVGRRAFPLVVCAESDRPVLDFSMGLINRDRENPVTNPNWQADFPFLDADDNPTRDGSRENPAYGTGFYHRDIRRNVLRPTTDIRFRVSDHDGLDLGVQGGAQSSMRITFTGSFVNAAGDVRPLTERDEGYLIRLSDLDVKSVFAPRTGSLAQRESEGTIPQSLLLNLLRANQRYRELFGGEILDGLNSLPDGLYLMTITVYDDPEFKLRSRPSVYEERKEPDRIGSEPAIFWIAVDNVSPAVYPDEGVLLPPDESRVTLDYFRIGSPLDDVGNWSGVGTIWDDNGPITITGFTVRVTEATPDRFEGESRDILRLEDGPSFSGAPREWARLTRLLENQDTWEYGFEAWVNLSRFFDGIEAGNFHFTFRVEDRFGNHRDIVRQHQQDAVAPTVVLTRGIETFTRPSLEGYYPDATDGGRIWISREHAAGSAFQPAGYLANGIVSFTAHALDNFTVDGLHWWLLPAGTGADGVSYLIQGGLTSDGVVHGFYSFPAWRDAAAAPPGRAVAIYDGTSVVGAFGRLHAPGGTVYIDTREMGLPDGAYVLHLVARDAHGNDSTPGHAQHPRAAQRIFLLQSEDRPYFDAGIAPAAGDVRGEHTLRITGIIMDDDGFGELEPESVRIWVSRDGAPPSDLSTAALNGWGVTHAHPLIAADGLTLSGRDIILNVDLRDLFGDDIFYVDGERRDGTIHYVIRAQDAWQSKLQIPGLPVDQSRQSRYRAFSFTIDTLPPAIYLRSPDPGWDANRRIFLGDFSLAGEISDVHLSAMPTPMADGRLRPYILWTLNSHATSHTTPARFPLPILPIDADPPDPDNTLEGAPGEEQTARFNVNMSHLLAGSHGAGNDLQQRPLPAPAWVSSFADMFENPDMDGEYVLELTVVDGIGLASVVTLNFTIDRRPPAINVNFPGRVPHERAKMTPEDFALWHEQGARTDQEWHDDRREWAAPKIEYGEVVREIPVIVHDTAMPPVLTGGIVDDFSDILLLANAGTPDVTFRFNNDNALAPSRVDWVGEGRNWRWEIDLAVGGNILPDGVHTLCIINASDGTGNHAETEHFAFRMDSRNPALDLYPRPQPDRYRVLGSADRFLTGPVLTIGGAARDTNLRNVRLTLRGSGVGEDRVAFIVGGASVFDSEEATLFGATTADWQWDAAESEWVLMWTFGLGLDDFAGLDPGRDYEIEVVALDWRASGGDSEPEIWTFTKDDESPDIFFLSDDAHSNAPPGGPANSGFTPFSPDPERPPLTFRGPGQTIFGTVADEHSGVYMVQFRIRTWNWDAAEDGDRWAYGEWRQIDPAGLTGSPRNRNWRTPALGPDGLDLDDGLYGLQIRAMDSSWGRDDAGNAVRYGNPVESDWLHFYFDRWSPDIGFSENPPPNMSSRFGTHTPGVGGITGHLGFHVTAGDDNRLERVIVSVEAENEDPITMEWLWADLAGLWDDDDGNLTKTFVVPVPISRNGMHAVVVTAYDFSGNRSQIRRGFGLDNAPPSGSFSSPDVDLARAGFSEVLGNDPAVVISGETSDAVGVESGPARAWLRFGLFGAVPSGDTLNEGTLGAMLDALVSHYTGGAVADDTARNDGLFDAASSWFEIGGATAPTLPHFGYANAPANEMLRVTRNNLFSWELQAATDNILALAQQAGMSFANVSDGGVLEMPIWFRVVDGAGNAGYFNYVIRINPEADRPVNRIENPRERDGERGSPRGGAVSFDGIAEIGMPTIQVDHVLFRVWVGRPRPTPNDPTPDGFVLWHDPDPYLPPADRTHYFLRVATPEDLSMTPVTDEVVDAVTDAWLHEFLSDHGLWEEGERFWFPADMERGSNIAPWSFRLNAGGELTAMMPEMGFRTPTAGVQDNNLLFVMVETIAINDGTTTRKMSIGAPEDGGSLPGASRPGPRPSIRMFYISNTAPAIFPDLESLISGSVENRNTARVEGSVNMGTGPDNPHRGVVTITAYLDAMPGMRITEVRIVRPEETEGDSNVGVSYYEFADSGDKLSGLSITPVPGFAAGRVYRLVYTLDSTEHGDVNAGDWARSGGLYRVEIRVSDYTQPDPSITTLTLPIVIDNFAPVADSGFRTAETRAGAWESFQGRVLDGSLYGTGAAGSASSTISAAHVGARIDRVYAWFESGVNSAANPMFIAHDGSGTRPINISPTPNPAMFPGLWIGRTADVDGAVVTLTNEGSFDVAGVRIPTALPSGAGNQWIMRISAETVGTQEGRNRGHLWIDSLGERAVQWMFSVNTMNLPDGPLTLRYIVVDEAGNASLFEQSIVIRNTIPEITEITLETADAGGNAVVLEPLRLGNHPPAGGYIDTGWTVRRRELGLAVGTLQEGNAPLNFRLQHVTRRRMELTRDNLTYLVGLRNNPADINLFTVDTVGVGVGDGTWRTLGYTGEGIPARGSHFVLSDLTPAQIDGFPATPQSPVPAPGTGNNIWVWVYTQVAPSVSHGPVGYRGGDAPIIGSLSFAEAAFAETNPAAANRIPHFVLARDPATGSPVPGTGPGQAGDPNRPFFLVRVWDSVTATNPPTAPNTPPSEPWTASTWPASPPQIENEQLHAAAVLAMDVFLFDILPPAVTLHDLNPFLETGVAPGNSHTPASRNNTIENALDPQAAGRDAHGTGYIETNRNRGGLFNTNTTSAPARSGHIEPRGGNEAARSSMFTDPPPSWEDFAEANRDVAHQSAFTVDQVSGRVILRGRATDNERVQSVELAITLPNASPTEPATPAVTNWFPILVWNDAVGEMVPVDRPANSAGANIAGYNLRVPLDDLERVPDVGVYETFGAQGGHVVEWSFLWDTVLANGGLPVAGVTVHVRVTDSQYQPGPGVTRPADSWRETSRVFDIVPYISGFERWGPAGSDARAYRTIRSMQGWYSFYQGETRIDALGWNLGTDTGAANMANMRLVRTGSEDTLDVTARTSRRVTFTVPTTAQSGRVELFVGEFPAGTPPTGGGTAILNHSTNPNQFWNRDDHIILDDRAALWNNRPYAHIWRTRHEADAPRTYMGSLTNNAGLSHPGMALEFAGGDLTGGGGGLTSSHGRLHGAWSVFGRENVYYGRNDGGGNVIATGQSDPHVNPDISIFRGSIAGANNWPNLAYVWFNDGAPAVQIRARSGQTGGVSAILTGAGTPTNRWRNVRTSNAMANPGGGGTGTTAAVLNNPGRLYTTVYDAFNRALVFVTSTSYAEAGQTRVIIDGGYGRTIGTAAGTGILSHTLVTGGVERSADAGLFSAVGFTGGDGAGGADPVVAYFDSANNSLRIAVGTGTAPAGAGFVRHDVLYPTHALHAGSGRYVSMAIDTRVANNPIIHLAFFNQRHGALVHTYAPLTGSGTLTSRFGANARVVDNVNGVGRWTDISLDHWGNPWIVYAYNDRSGNFDGIRVAYRSHGNTAAGDGMGTNVSFTRANVCRVTGGTIAGWEAVQMAAPFRVAYDRLNIAAWPPARHGIVGGTPGTMDSANRPPDGGTQGRAWGAAIGYASGSGDNRFRIGYFFWPNVTFYGQ